MRHVMTFPRSRPRPRGRVVTPLLALAALTAAAHADAGFHKYKASASLTASVLNGGDRQLTVLRFAGSSSSFTGDDFLRWGDGSLSTNTGTYGWTDLIPPETPGDSASWVNPDRAENATPYTLESAGGASLRDVFGPFGPGYKNMSYMLDAEDSTAWSLDLFLDGTTLSADSSADTIELAILERGDDSNIRVRGIRGDMSLTAAANIARGNFDRVGWSANTFGVAGAENVAGVGVSLDASWTDLIGFRFESDNGMNGPDLVGIATVAGAPLPPATIPAPGSAALVMLGGAAVSRRRRGRTGTRTVTST